MEPMVAAVDTCEFNSLRKFSFISLFISLTESFIANVASTSQVVVVIRHYFLDSSVHIVDDLLVFFDFVVALLLTALLNVFLNLGNLIIIETL